MPTTPWQYSLPFTHFVLDAALQSPEKKREAIDRLGLDGMDSPEQSFVSFDGPRNFWGEVQRLCGNPQIGLQY